MSRSKTTYSLSAEQVREYVREPQPGMLLPHFELKDEQGRWLRYSDDHLSGRPLLLLLLNDPNGLRASTWLAALAAKHADIAQRDAYVVIVNANSDARHNAEQLRQHGLYWPMPSDSSGRILAGLGLHKDCGPSDRLLLVSPFRQIISWWDEAVTPTDTLLEALNTMSSPNTDPDRLMPPHAPVLAVPNVLTPQECADLIKAFESDTPFTARPPKPGELQSDFQIPVYEHNRQDRVDHIIRDQRMIQFLDERIFGRIVPMVKRAFAFDVTRREDLHIARYVGERSGNQMGHRDNISAQTAHRRFALSLNLNDDYEGGDVVFREYDERGYKSPAGTAMIFSSALLHEVRETTQGTRYTLISHFFNEQSMQRPPG